MQGSHGTLQYYLQQHTSALFSIPYGEDKRSDALEVVRHPESTSPLRQVVVKPLAPKRSSLHDSPRQPFAPNFQSPRVAMTASPLFLPPVHVASSRPRRQDFFPGTASKPAFFSKSERIFSEKMLQLVTSCPSPYNLATNQRAPRSQKWAGAEVTLQTA